MKPYAKRLVKGIWLALFACLLALLSLTACGEGETSGSDSSPAVSVTLSAKEASVEVGKTYTLTVAVKGSEEAATWTTSAAEVATVDGGKITGVSVGTAVITAAVGEVSDSCTVTVSENTSVPVITLSQSEAEPLIGKTVTVTATVACDGVTVDAPLTWNSDDTSVATVENGTIKGVSAGTTVVRVGTSWLGVSAEKTIAVTVRNDISLTLDKNALTLGTANVGEWKVSETLVASLEVNGETVTTGIEWATSDETVVTVVNGTVTALKTGSATVTATWSNGDGLTIDVSCAVTVEQSRIDTEIAADYQQYTGFEADASNLLLPYKGTANTAALAIDLSGYNLADGSYGVTFAKGNTSVSFTGTLASGKINVSAADLLTLDGGEYSFAVDAGAIIYDGSALIVTRYLENKSDVEMMQAYGKVWGTTENDKGYAYGGYFVMKNNIDMSSLGYTGQADQAKLVRAPLAARYSGNFGAADKTMGFTGTFDGNGYSLIGGQYRAGGLFGAVASTGVIKNVGISGAKIAVDTSQFNGILGYNFYGKLENAFIDVHFFTEGTASEIKTAHSILAFYMAAEEGALTNVVVHASATERVLAANEPHALVYWSGGTQKCANVYLFSDVTITNGTSSAFSGVTRYTISQIGTSDVDVKGLDSAYWTTTENVPRFTTSAAIKDSVSLTLDKATLRLGVAAIDGMATEGTLTATLKVNNRVETEGLVWSSSAPAIATVENGLVKAVAIGSATITVTYTAADGTQVTAVCAVEVVSNEVDTQLSLDYEIYGGVQADDSALGGYVPVVNSNGFTIDLSAHNPADGDVTVDFTKDGIKTTLNGTVSSGVVSVLATDMTQLDGGMYAFTVNQDGKLFTGEAFVVTKYLESKTDVELMQIYGKVSGDSTNGYAYGGYFVMKNNIDMSSLGYTGQTDQAKLVRAPLAVRWGVFPVDHDKTIGFRGTFDGQGYTLSGGQYRAGGIFGAVASTGVIKNVGISGAKIAVDSSHYNGILGYNFYGSLENVYVNVHFFRENAANKINEHHSILAFYMDMGENTMTNVVVYATTDEDSAAAGSPCALVHWTGGTQKGVNVYMFSDVSLTDGASGAFSGVARYTLDETRAGAASNVSGLPAEYWNFTGDIPSFKTADAVELEDVIELTLGSSSLQLGLTAMGDIGTTGTLTATLKVNGATTDATFTWTSSAPAIATVNNGTVTAAAVGSTTITVAYTAADGTVYTATCLVEVVGSEVATELTLDYELYGSVIADSATVGGYRPVANADGFTIDLSAWNPAEGDVTVTFTGDVTLTLNGTLASGHVFVSGEAMAALTGSTDAYTFSVNVQGNMYTGSVTVVTKYLRTKADVEMMQIYGGITANYTYGGYFVLANSIDMDAAGYNGQAVLVRAPLATRYIGGTVDKTIGFNGTFDGKGFSLLGGLYRSGGIFGAVASTGQIQHVGISEAKIAVDTSLYNAVIAYNFYGKVLDMYLGVHFFVQNEGGTVNSHHAILAHYMNTSTYAFRNVVIYATADEAVLASENKPCGLAHWSPEAQKMWNVYLISDLTANSDAATFTDYGTKAAQKLNCYTISQIGTGEIKQTGLPTKNGYWDFTKDFPIFVSSIVTTPPATEETEA